MAVSPQQIDNYLRSRKSPLAGLGRTFVQAGKRFGVDPYLLVAISGAESAFGAQARNHNPFGWGPHIPFKSWDQAIFTVARGLRTGYLNEGRKTIGAIGSKWAPIGAGNDPTNLNSNWVRNVTRFYRELGGAGFKGGPQQPEVRGIVAQPFEMPDVSQAALLNLGERSPQRQLSNLVASVASQPSPEAPAPAAPAPAAAGPAVNLGGLAELIYDKAGRYYVDGGKRVKGQHGGHGSHVHIAFGNQQSILAAIKQAQRMGLTVREHPSVDKVDPVHTKNSYHYKGLAADVSGDAKRLRAFFEWAERAFRG